MRSRFFFFAPFALLAFLGFIALGGYIVQVLWNWLLPDLFGWPAVTFWQALGLLLLSRILFGGVGGRRGGHGWGHGSRMRSRIRERMAERWHDLPEEERDTLRARMRMRFGADEPPESRDL
jgi:hypothetical protein